MFETTTLLFLGCRHRSPSRGFGNLSEKIHTVDAWDILDIWRISHSFRRSISSSSGSWTWTFAVFLQTRRMFYFGSFSPLPSRERENISYLGKLGICSSTQSVGWLVGDMLSFPGGYLKKQEISFTVPMWSEKKLTKLNHTIWAHFFPLLWRLLIWPVSWEFNR